MNDSTILQLATVFRSAIEEACFDGTLNKDFRFHRFPTGCCGDTCYLLAEFLHENGIKSVFYSAQRGDWSHAWLVIKDKRVLAPLQKSFSWPVELHSVLTAYGVEDPGKEIINENYEFDDLKNGLIVDITADQFSDYNEPVYVGYADAFHRSFDFIQAHDIESIPDNRLTLLSRMIERYLP